MFLIWKLQNQLAACQLLLFLKWFVYQLWFLFHQVYQSQCRDYNLIEGLVVFLLKQLGIQLQLILVFFHILFLSGKLPSHHIILKFGILIYVDEFWLAIVIVDILLVDFLLFLLIII